MPDFDPGAARMARAESIAASPLFLAYSIQSTPLILRIRARNVTGNRVFFNMPALRSSSMAWLPTPPLPAAHIPSYAPCHAEKSLDFIWNVMDSDWYEQAAFPKMQVHRNTRWYLPADRLRGRQFVSSL
jgi:hypothetical protein